MLTPTRWKIRPSGFLHKILHRALHVWIPKTSSGTFENVEIHWNYKSKPEKLEFFSEKSNFRAEIGLCAQIFFKNRKVGVISRISVKKFFKNIGRLKKSDGHFKEIFFWNTLYA